MTRTGEVVKTDSDYDRGYRDGLEEGKQDVEALSEHLRESREEAYEKGAELAKLRAENGQLRSRVVILHDVVERSHLALAVALEQERAVLGTPSRKRRK